MNATTRRPPRVMILASHYRADHAACIPTYHALNKAASTWNNALFAELRKMDIELHIVQFYPVLRRRVFREDNATYYYLPRIPKVDGFTSRVKALRVRRLANEIRPDLIHGIGSEHGHAYAALSGSRPSIITIHGYLERISALPGHRSLLRRLFLVPEERAALKRASRIIAINGYMRDQFIDAGCDRDRIVEIPNALNPIFLSDCGDAERDIDILMVGTLHPLKNQHLALRMLAALRRLHGDRPSVVIAGAPAAASRGYQQELLAYRREHGLDNVEFAGSVDPVALKALYCRSRILLHISQFEADPTVVAEALACGTLPVVNPVAGLAYRVRDAVNGVHLPLTDLDAAATRLRAVLADPEGAARLVASGRDEVRRLRSARSVAESTYALYRAVLRAG